MGMEARTVAQSFTYAWWLTGDDDAAARAVRQASVRLDADPTPDLVLATVREAAIRAPTMCPASEVALLHDSHGLDLPQAALLVEVDADDARTELAHGRLEALPELSDRPFSHPERLGGLAVGNPPDVAHARQCEDCARARDLLDRGRGALRTLPPVPVPSTLLMELSDLDREDAEAFAAAPVTIGADGEPRAALRADAEVGSDVDRGHAEAEGEAGGEGEAEGAEPARPLGTILAVAAIGLGVALLLVTALTSREVDEAGLADAEQVLRDDAADADPPTDETTDADPPTDETIADPDPSAPDPDTVIAEPDALTVRDVRVGAVSALHDTAAMTLGAFDALRVTVGYAGADEGDTLGAQPVFEGLDLPTNTVSLGAGDGAHVFVWPAPTEGWPTGPHQVRIVSDGAIIAAVTVRVE